MPFFDTHAHLADPQLESELVQWLDLANREGLIGITAIATTPADSEQCLQLARQYDLVHASVGVHCNECQRANDSDWDHLSVLAEDAHVVAIGETGLDLYWDDCPLDRQRNWFDRHLLLARKLDKPVVIHMRECEPQMLEALTADSRRGPLKGIMHSFSGSWQMAKRCLDFGLHLSFAGMVTFKKSDALREIAARVPTDRLLIETDAPYLTPHPFRGKRPNHPAMVVHTAACLAELRGISLTELGERTTENALQIFGLSPKTPSA